MQQEMTRNLFKIAKKSTKLGAKTSPNSVPGAFWEGLGGVWGASWPQEAPRHQQEVRKVRALAPPQTPKLGPKSIKIFPKSDPKGDHFCDHFLDRLLKRFGANLAPTWFPKPSQNGGKLAPKSMQVGLSIFKLFLKGSWHQFYWFFALISNNLKNS